MFTGLRAKENFPDATVRTGRQSEPVAVNSGASRSSPKGTLPETLAGRVTKRTIRARSVAAGPWLLGHVSSVKLVEAGITPRARPDVEYSERDIRGSPERCVRHRRHAVDRTAFRVFRVPRNRNEYPNAHGVRSGVEALQRSALPVSPASHNGPSVRRREQFSSIKPIASNRLRETTRAPSPSHIASSTKGGRVPSRYRGRDENLGSRGNDYLVPRWCKGLSTPRRRTGTWAQARIDFFPATKPIEVRSRRKMPSTRPRNRCWPCGMSVTPCGATARTRSGHAADAPVMSGWARNAAAKNLQSPPVRSIRRSRRHAGVGETADTAPV